MEGKRHPAAARHDSTLAPPRRAHCSQWKVRRNPGIPPSTDSNPPVRGVAIPAHASCRAAIATTIPTTSRGIAHSRRMGRQTGRSTSESNNRGALYRKRLLQVATQSRARSIRRFRRSPTPTPPNPVVALLSASSASVSDLRPSTAVQWSPETWMFQRCIRIRRARR